MCESLLDSLNIGAYDYCCYIYGLVSFQVVLKEASPPKKNCKKPFEFSKLQYKRLWRSLKLYSGTFVKVALSYTEAFQGFFLINFSMAGSVYNLFLLLASKNNL